MKPLPRATDIASARRRQGRCVIAVAFGLLSLSSCNTQPSSDKSQQQQRQDGVSTAKATPPSSDSQDSSRIRVDWLKDALGGCIYRNGSEQQHYFLPETTGGGIAAFDYDRDGRIDIAAAGGGYPVPSERAMKGYPGSLMRCVEKMRFTDAKSYARMDLSEIYNAAIAIGDWDADGFSDLLATGYSGLQLLRNQGDGTFEKMPNPRSGLVDSLWSSSAVWFDADGDGLLDLYVAHYADWSYENDPKCSAPKESGSQEVVPDYCGPRAYKGLPDTLFANQGDGTFNDITKSAGIADSLRGLGIIVADLDGDRDADIYVANDVDPNLLYRNDGGFKFTEMARRSGVACNDVGIPEGSMGIALADYNGDGRFDLWVTNYQNEIGALYRSSGNMLFSYASQSARIPATDQGAVGWGTAFADMDLDGKEDIFIVNGHVELHANGSSFEQRPQILHNIDRKYFRLVSRDESEFLSTPQSARSLAMADFNDDGRMDFAVSRLNTEAVLVTNRTETDGLYLKVRLAGTRSNRDGIGTTVRMLVGEQTYLRQLVGGGTYAGTNDSVLHFGVPASLSAEKPQLTILWPSGIEQKVEVDGWNQELLVVEQE
ncbi:MAG: VCBS repeat-containing protein [Planctomycetes bacterium]|nr:VCBS repeat-containing protein [Planctomycetota bacterium]